MRFLAAKQDVFVLGTARSVLPDTKAFLSLDFSQPFDVTQSLQGTDIVVHCAALVHNMTHGLSLADYQKINTDATLCLLRQAEAAGVKRFVFLSSIKVNGEYTELGDRFTESVTVPPTDPYGLSKYQAELTLLEFARHHRIDVTIIRPPLVYGPGVKANFKKLCTSVKRGIPLPFGMVNNLRSLVYIGNLVDFIWCCINHPRAANQTFLISDDHDVSTAELCQCLAKSYRKHAFLLPIPERGIRWLCSLLGKRSIAMRICGSLVVDISKAKSDLGWVPPYKFEEGIHATTV